MIDRNGKPVRILAVGEELPPMEDASPSASRTDRAKPGTDKATAGERFATLNAFTDFALADLSRAEIAVWLVLYRDTRDGTARTSYDDLSRRAGLNRRNVGRALRRLEGRGLVKTVHRGGIGRGVSRYRVRGLPKDT
jgi:DNA-binding transcriptional ArsR family regulator